MNIVLRTHDPAVRRGFLRLAPKWRLLDGDEPVSQPHVLVVDLRGGLEAPWREETVRGWIALGQEPDHFRWASQRGAALCVGWPCSPKQLREALLGAEEASPDNPVITWPGNIAWIRRRSVVRKGRRLFHLTPHESHIMDRLWERLGLYTTPADLLERVWDGSVLSEQNVYVHIRNLRRKLELVPGRPRILRCRRGYGYRLAVPAWERQPERVAILGERETRWGDALASGAQSPVGD